MLATSMHEERRQERRGTATIPFWVVCAHVLGVSRLHFCHDLLKACLALSKDAPPPRALGGWHSSLKERGGV
jgi:hypothetical protein